MKQNLLIASAFAATLAAAKMYFSGGTCTVTRDLSGQVAVVTGGNTGIGKETAKELAKRGCTVIIASRDGPKGAAAVKEIQTATMNKNVTTEPLDLSSKPSIQQFASAINSKYGKVDILVNNAGIMALPNKTLSPQGHEMQMAVNHLGHFYLTSLLWSSLRKSKELRIVNVSSILHKKNPIEPSYPVKIDFDTMDGTYHAQDGKPHDWDGKYDPQYAYSASKMANVLFSQELAERLEKINLDSRAMSVHPGVVRTDLARYGLTSFQKTLVKVLYPLIWLVTKNPHEGAQTTLYCILQDKSKLTNGGYYADCNLAERGEFAKDPANQKKLWHRSEEMMESVFALV